MRYIVTLPHNAKAYGSFDTVAEAQSWIDRNGLASQAIICEIVKVR